ncbi:replication initiator [Parasphingorhabdus pacifica]
MPASTRLSTPDPHRSGIGGPGYKQWRSKVEATGGCTHPVHLSGTWGIQDNTTHQLLNSRSGQVTVPCGNRRESVCPACSDRYAADAFHLLRAGLSGGTKNIPATVAEKPRLFLTLTAPSFGPVHNARTAASGRRVPCRCGEHHHPDDPRLGQPIDPEAYDYTGHVLWQAHAGALWSRFTRYLKRHIAMAAGLTVREFGDHARLSFAKVAEYQRRGLIHFHAVLRLDGPDGPSDPTPGWGTTELLTNAIHAAHTAVYLTSPEVDGQTRELTFGEQIDIRPIRPVNASQIEDEHGVITDDRLASYVAKYATKGTGKSEATDRPIRSQGHIDLLQASPHHRRIIQTAWDLAAPVACPDCHPHGQHQPDNCGCDTTDYCPTCQGGGHVARTVLYQRAHPEHADKPDPIDALNLRRWAHMLAFRGHFLSKSQYYSVPFRQIRNDRRQYRHEQALAELGIEDESTITVINEWDMTSVGHTTPEQRELAAAIAERTRDARKHRYHTERKD